MAATLLHCHVAEHGLAVRLVATSSFKRTLSFCYMVKDSREYADSHCLNSVSSQLLPWWRTPCRCVFYGDLYPNQECYEEPISDGLKRLMEVRKKFAYGERSDYFHHANCIGFVRKGNAAGPGCAVLVSNAEPKE